MRLPIIALAVAAFAIGTSEFVIMGLLPQIAGDLGVTIPSAGLLVTGYALGVVFGDRCSRWRPRRCRASRCC